MGMHHKVALATSTRHLYEIDVFRPISMTAIAELIIPGHTTRLELLFLASKAGDRARLHSGGRCGELWID